MSELFEDQDGIYLLDGRFLVTHPEGACAGEHCSVHGPSDHALNTAPLNWRSDRHLMERICKHGIGHPDPDDLEYKKKIYGENYDNYAFGVHGCDGCCRG